MGAYIAARPLLMGALGVLAGIGLARLESPLAAAAALGMGLAFLLFGAPARRVAVLLFLSAGSAGITTALRQQDRLARDRLALEAMRVDTPPVSRVELIVADLGFDPFAERAWILGRTRTGLGVIASWSGDAPMDAGCGARVLVFGQCREIRPPRNPGEADRRVRLARFGASLSLDARVSENVVVLTPASEGLRKHAEHLRRAGVARLRRVMPGSVAPLAAAILFGLRGGIDSDQHARFARSGTLHLLAISGFHLLLLAGILHHLLRAVGLGPRMAAGLVLAASVLYVPLTGGAPPIRRAFSVILVYGIALLRGRRADIGNALGGAALLLLLSNPSDLDAIGTRLSFLAAAGIAWLARGWARRWSRRHRFLSRFPAVRRDRRLRLPIARYLLYATPVALAASLATLPWVAASFGRVNPLAPLVNLVAGPLLSLSLPLCALTAAGVPGAAAPATWVLSSLVWWLDVAESLPGGHLAVLLPPAGVVAAWTAGVVALRARPRLGVAMLLAATLVWFARPVRSLPPLVLFDVGHGQAALLQTPSGKNVLVDAGTRAYGPMARRRLLPALRVLDVRRLDLVVCTHFDGDHWNALPDLLHEIPVRAFVSPAAPPPRLLAALDRRGVPRSIAKRGEWLVQESGYSLQVIGTGGGRLTHSNNQSIVLRLELENGSILLPADRESDGLAALLRQPAILRADVLLAPHHGARCEIAAVFGRAVRPRWVVTSSATDFAHAPTLVAYGACFRIGTMSHGCLAIEAEHGTLEPFPLRR
ncbi:MAG: ComEC/Rec2 family competence protein [Planctomycetota bacterium]